LYLCDLGVTLFALWLARELRLALPFGQATTAEGVSLDGTVYVLVAAIWTVVFFTFSVYSPRNVTRFWNELRVVSSAVVFSTLSLTGALYLSYRGLSRLLFFYFFLLDGAMLLVLRWVGRAWLARATACGFQTHNVLLVGADGLSKQLAQAARSLTWAEWHVVGCVADTLADSAGQASDLPILGSLNQVEQIIAQCHVQEVIFTNPRRDREAVARLLVNLEEKPINVWVVPDLTDMAFFHATVDEVSGIPLIGLKGPVLDEYQRLIKRIMDVVLATLALVLGSPLLLACALAIRLDSAGPILYRQKRVGENGRLFWMFKFRTMIPDADKDENRLIAFTSEGKPSFQKRADDPRITRAGRLLRRYSLDELPQLWNVIKGDMSLVGPRPELPALMELYQVGQKRRLCVPPGLTGWWQINGRSDHDKSAQAESDLYYLQNYSLRLDLQILWRTLGAVLRGKGAY